MAAIKISGFSKAALGLTAVFLALMVGYFLGARQRTVPYRVDAQSTAQETLPPAATPAPAPVVRVNINTATAQELETLPGIGAKRAADIVADRTGNGPFLHVEDITRVKGIGQGTLEHLLDYITVDEDIGG